jgi:aspartate aminotransferase
MLVLNSPSNPTGAMYSRAEYAALGDVLLTAPGGEGVWVISDEIYDRIILGKVPFCSFLEACPKLRERSITVNGMSKSCAMTGWRIGWSVAPASVTQGMITLQGQCTSGINSLAQWASVAALKLPESDFAAQTESYRRRRDLTLEILGKAGKIKVFAPEGAFYVFAGMGAVLRSGEDSFAFAERLLAEAKVAVVPGTPFGEPEFVRLSFATDERSLKEGCQRIVDYVRR